MQPQQNNKKLKNVKFSPKRYLFVGLLFVSFFIVTENGDLVTDTGFSSLHDTVSRPRDVNVPALPGSSLRERDSRMIAQGINRSQW